MAALEHSVHFPHKFRKAYHFPFNPFKAKALFHGCLLKILCFAILITQSLHVELLSTTYILTNPKWLYFTSRSGQNVLPLLLNEQFTSQQVKNNITNHRSTLFLSNFTLLTQAVLRFLGMFEVLTRKAWFWDSKWSWISRHQQKYFHIANSLGPELFPAVIQCQRRNPLPYIVCLSG